MGNGKILTKSPSSRDPVNRNPKREPLEFSRIAACCDLETPPELGWLTGQTPEGSKIVH